MGENGHERPTSTLVRHAGNLRKELKGFVKGIKTDFVREGDRL